MGEGDVKHSKLNK